MIYRATALLVSVTLVAAACSNANGAYEDVVIADSPVAFWQMDEPDDGAEPIDATGNVPTLAFGWDDQGGMSFGNPGIPGSSGTSVIFHSESFSFACKGACGAGEVMLEDDFQDGLLDLGTTEGDMPITMEAWFTLLEGWEGSSYPRLFHYNNFDGGQYTFGVAGNDVPNQYPEARTVWGGRGDGGGNSIILAAESDTLPSGEGIDEDQWFHLVAQSSGDDMRLWLNGQELTDLFDSDPIGWQARQATIGARVQNNLSVVQSFPGRIDQVAIYDKLLSEDRIVAHYEAGIGNEPLDINTLQDAINAGDQDSRYDVNGDGVVNVADQDYFVHETLNTWLGDSNLDGLFDSSDLVTVFTAGKYEDNNPDDPSTITNARWEEGDWNSDREFDSSDLVTAFVDGGYEAGPRAAVAAVPEPSSALLLLLSLPLLSCVRRKKQTGSELS